MRGQDASDDEQISSVTSRDKIYHYKDRPVVSFHRFLYMFKEKKRCCQSEAF